MGRYLRTLKPTTPGRVVRVGPAPTAGRVEIDDPATWEAARELNQATTELNARLYARRIDGEDCRPEMMALRRAEDADTLEAAGRSTAAGPWRG